MDKLQHIHFNSSAQDLMHQHFGMKQGTHLAHLMVPQTYKENFICLLARFTILPTKMTILISPGTNLHPLSLKWCGYCFLN